MARRRWAAPFAALALVGALALGAVACGDSEEADPTPVLTPKITPASGGRTAVATTAATSEPTAVETAAETPAGGETPASGEAQEFTIVGQNVQFDVTELEAEPGEITIIFQNEDGGVPHNIAFWQGDEADGDPVAATELQNGPAEDTLTFTVESGDYYYQCDAHPATMSGTLAVS